MSGFLTNGLPNLAIFTGAEKLNADTLATAGGQPQSEAITLAKLAKVMRSLQNSLSKTMVDGTFYYSQYNVGVSYTPTPRGSTISEQSFLITGANIAVGGTGGSDTWRAYLWNSAGVCIAASAAAGVTAGTALTI